MRSSSSPLQILRNLAGRRAIVWLVVGSVSGVALAIVELGFSLILAALVQRLGLAQAEILNHTVSRLIPDTGFGLVVVFTLVGFLRAACIFFGSFSAIAARELIVERLRLACIQEVTLTNPGKYPASLIQTRMAETFPKTAIFCHYLALTFPALFKLILLFAFMAWFSVQYTAIGLVGFIVVGIVVKTANQNVRRIAQRIPAEYQALTEKLFRVVRNWPLLRILRTTDREHAALVIHTSDYTRHSISTGALASFTAVLPQIAGVILILVIIQIHLSAPMIAGLSLLSFLYLLVRFTQAAGEMAANLGHANAHLPFAKEAVDFTQSMKISAFAGNARRTSALERFTGKDYRKNRVGAPEIEVQGLTFGYDSQIVIENLSFVARAGTQIGIVGPSGSGKSTLLALITGAARPRNGTILLDRRDPVNYFADPNVKVGYVGPEPFLIDGTIRENLLYGSRVRYSDEDLKDAIRDARLDDELLVRRGGLDLSISEAREGLSTGQLQRLSLARAILGRPNLLILDELTANLDNVTEQRVAETVASFRGSCTTLIVSHKAGILKYSDQVVKLEAHN